MAIGFLHHYAVNLQKMQIFSAHYIVHIIGSQSLCEVNKMNYKSMTVCLDNGAGSSRRLEFALGLASQHGAQLNGLLISYAPLTIYGPYGEMAPAIAAWEISNEEKQQEEKKSFQRAAKAAGLSFDSAVYRSSEISKMIAHARESDISIIGQYNPAEKESGIGKNFPEIFVLKLGRPVLILPHTRNISPIFKKVVVAWDGGREAARALADAIPLLQLARRVKVLSVLKKNEQEKDFPRIDIAAYLTKHDVNASVEVVEEVDFGVADWMLSRAAEFEADLLVMGAYGHHRLTELILGGMTRSILRNMTLPVLMSH
jgi:nucleotide-binding universal stress UspA family protein